MLPKSIESQSLTRRAFLAGTGTIAVGVALDAFVIEPRWLEVTRHDIVVPDLPRGLSGCTVAQITDAHLTQIGAVEDAIFGHAQP